MSGLRISTITATASVNYPVDLKKLFDDIPLEDGVVFVEYGRVKTERITRGVHPRMTEADDVPTKKKHGCNTGRRFDNQTTIVMRVQDSCVNLKVFGNGSVQMTGLKRIEDGPLAVNIVVKAIKAVSSASAGEIDDKACVDDMTMLECVDYRVRMINSDFRLGWPVRRDYAYVVMMREYGMRCFYEASAYPGLKIEYYYNPSQDARGICKCEDRGLSVKCSHCHKVTLVVVRSGSVIITGASTIAHLDAAHAFILEVLNTHREELEHVEYRQLTMDDDRAS